MIDNQSPISYYYEGLSYLSFNSYPIIPLLGEICIMSTRNKLRKIREDRLISKMELARLAGVSPATIERIERGEACRIETMRKIILSLGYSLADKEIVFPS